MEISLDVATHGHNAQTRLEYKNTRNRFFSRRSFDPQNLLAIGWRRWRIIIDQIFCNWTYVFDAEMESHFSVTKCIPIY